MKQKTSVALFITAWKYFPIWLLTKARLIGYTNKTNNRRTDTLISMHIIQEDATSRESLHHTTAYPSSTSWRNCLRVHSWRWSPKQPWCCQQTRWKHELPRRQQEILSPHCCRASRIPAWLWPARKGCDCWSRLRLHRFDWWPIPSTWQKYPKVVSPTEENLSIQDQCGFARQICSSLP